MPYIYNILLKVNSNLLPGRVKSAGKDPAGGPGSRTKKTRPRIPGRAKISGKDPARRYL